MKIAIHTLGCKINQFDADVIRQDLSSRGNTIVPFDAEADVYIVNTCSVTAKSDYQCRQAIRSATRRGKGAKVVVTGCYAETRPDEIRNISGVDRVFGNRDKAKIVDHILSAAPATETPPGEAGIASESVRTRTRGLLKIQEGCDNRCSYCIVPLARGGSRSAHPRGVAEKFESMVRRGCPEIVLTGIHIGAYGADLAEKTDLTSLIATLVSKKEDTRIRLSSIEPREITDEMVRMLGRGLCRHLHIPLQSGDDGILASMRRNYSSAFYLELIERIADRVPGVALGADVMVGFPGEGEKEFLNTLRLVERSPLTHLHVFSYSPRPGTPAAGMKKQVPEVVKKERSEALRDLGKKKNLDFRKKNIGCAHVVVVEYKVSEASGLFTGLTDNYIRVQIYGSKKENVGKRIQVSISAVDEKNNFAEIM